MLQNPPACLCSHQLSTCMPVHPPACLCIHVPACACTRCPPACLCTHLPACAPTCLPVHALAVHHLPACTSAVPCACLLDDQACAHVQTLPNPQGCLCLAPVIFWPATINRASAYCACACTHVLEHSQRLPFRPYLRHVCHQDDDACVCAYACICSQRCSHHLNVSLRKEQDGTQRGQLLRQQQRAPAPAAAQRSGQRAQPAGFSSGQQVWHGTAGPGRQECGAGWGQHWGRRPQRWYRQRCLSSGSRSRDQWRRPSAAAAAAGRGGRPSPAAEPACSTWARCQGQLPGGVGRCVCVCVCVCVHVCACVNV